VWEVVTDIRRAPEVLSGVVSVELMTDGPYALGTRWRETRRMLGRETTEEMWVVANDPGRRTEVAASSSGTDYRTVFTLTPDDGATELTVTFSGRTPEPSAVQRLTEKVFGRLGTAVVRKVLEQDLADIAAAS
jgi:hypothetical protein